MAMATLRTTLTLISVTSAVYHVFVVLLILISSIHSHSSSYTLWNSNSEYSVDFYDQQRRHSSFGREDTLTLVQFKNKSVACNDGTTAGYYIHRSTKKSKLWIIHLEGGWFCYNVHSCTNRWLHMKNLMSSSNWNRHKYADGILSNNPKENPHWWNANHVFVPYCSSDLWTGHTANHSNGYSFMGSVIVESVVNDLLYKFKPRSTIILAGSSAGGIGVLLNVDRVQSLVNSHFKSGQITVKGIVDSAWFLESNINSSILSNLKHGLALWNSKLPSYCTSESCFYGSKIYPHIKSELFIFQWLFDEIQMLLMNIQIPILDKNEWEMVYKFGNELRHSLSNVTSFMIPSCISHTVLLNSYHWNQLQINAINLPTILYCWDTATTKERAHKSRRSYLINDPQLPYSSQDSLSSNHSRRRRRHRRRHKKNRHHQRLNRLQSADSNGLFLQKTKRNNNESNSSNVRKNRSRPSGGHNSWIDSTCTDLGQSYKLIDSCMWPQCNINCPKLINPNTGSEIEFKELLSSFGLDLKLMASVLGIDLNTLETMDPNILLKLLTQQQQQQNF